jgi:hypothetical protein
MSQRFLITGAPRPHATPAAMGPHMKAEIDYVWRHHESGFIREIYERGDALGVIMVLEAASPAEVKTFIDELPLVKAGFLDVQFMSLKPFSMWNVLFASH